MANEWYRKKTWTKEDENEFLIKLKRAKDYSRSQYLIIQAHTLYDTNNDELLAIALNLVHKYFDVYPDDKFERSVAYGLMGHIYCRMKKYDTALENYKNAVDYERNIFPNCRTNAYLDYAELVIQLNRTELFENVETLLLEKVEDVDFPKNKYIKYAILSIIYKYKNNLEKANYYRILAEEAANAESSDFRYHKKLGLVNNRNELLDKLMEKILQFFQ
jgi:tetratricopeptide (TPR) repeat protein